MKKYLIALITLGCLLATQWVSAATAVWFDEQEPGTDTYAVRMIVTDAYLRIDDGTDASDYILLDRSDGTIYSVNHEDQTVIDIKRTPVSIPKPSSLTHSAEVLEMKKGPPIDGKEVRLYQLKAAGKKCSELAAADGLLPDVVKALKEYRLTLAGEQSQVTQIMPERLRNDCDLVENIFAPAAHLEHGFPVFHRNFLGRVRSLKTMDKSFIVNKNLFELPADYRHFSPANLRTGG